MGWQIRKFFRWCTKSGPREGDAEKVGPPDSQGKSTCILRGDQSNGVANGKGKAYEAQSNGTAPPAEACNTGG